MANKKQQEITTVIKIAGAIDKSLDAALASAQGMATKLSGGFVKAMSTAKAAVQDFVVNNLKEFPGEYANAMSALARNTGELGKDLIPTQKSFEAVMAKIPLSIKDIGQAVGDVRTLMKYSGEDLEKTTITMGKLSQITGQSVQDLVKASAAVQKGFGLSGNALNAFAEVAYKAVLQTGQSFDDLAKKIGENSVVLRQLGLDEQEAVYLMAGLTDAGVKQDVVLSALRKNIDMSAEDFDKWGAAVQSATSEEEALKIATDAWGKEAAPEMVKAIRAGVFNLAAMKEQFDANKISIDKMSKETMTWDETIQLLGNSLKKLVLPVLKQIAEWVKVAADYYSKLGSASEIWADLKDSLGFGSDKKAAALPKKASGGWVFGPSIAGEAGPEAVISMDPAYRAANLQTWAEAGQALGIGGGINVTVQGLSFAPTITSAGIGNADVMAELKNQSREFAAMVAAAIDSNMRRAF